MHTCINKLTINDSDNGLSPGRHQAIIWTNARILLIGPLGTKICEIFIKINIYSFKKMHLKMMSRKWQPFCLNVLTLAHAMACCLRWCQASTWTNDDFSSNVFCGIYRLATSQKEPMNLILIMCSMITHFNLLHFSGANESNINQGALLINHLANDWVLIRYCFKPCWKPWYIVKTHIRISNFQPKYFSIFLYYGCCIILQLCNGLLCRVLFHP